MENYEPIEKRSLRVEKKSRKFDIIVKRISINIGWFWYFQIIFKRCLMHQIIDHSIQPRCHLDGSIVRENRRSLLVRKQYNCSICFEIDIF